MTLVNRVSAFFLAALAMALICYSAVFYVLTRNYLYQQFDDDLHSALHILAASVEVEIDDAKWHPAEHGIDLAAGALNDLVWLVCDERGQVVDRSPSLSRSDPHYETIQSFASQPHEAEAEPIALGQWRLLQKELAAPEPKPLNLREPFEYASVRITVARSQAQLMHTLNRLAILVCLLPMAVWLTAAAIGHWYVRHALSPVRKMANRARSVTQADFGLRLPVSSTPDELTDLGVAFNQLLNQLQTAYERQSRFVGDAAHQLRTPLAALQGQLDVAKRRPRSTEDYQKTLEVLSEQTSELVLMVESLLRMARSEEGVNLSQREIICLDEWMKVYLCRWDHHERRNDLVLHSGSKVRVLTSQTLLTQILDNLLTNAFKYSPAGGPILIETTQNSGQAVLSVTDQGIGISAKEKETIFEPFYRSPEVRRSGFSGTGLGLSVAARIAEVLEGQLTCNSEWGRGSTFQLTLPVAPEPTSKQPG